MGKLSKEKKEERKRLKDKRKRYLTIWLTPPPGFQIECIQCGDIDSYDTNEREEAGVMAYREGWRYGLSSDKNHGAICGACIKCEDDIDIFYK